jgi:uncharacterized membrane protein YhaH (DUF805 family)
MGERVVNNELNKEDTSGQFKILTGQGRIGRVRYIAYSNGLIVLATFLWGVIGVVGFGVISPLLGGDESKIGLFVGLGSMILFIAFVVIYFLMSIRRIHDFNVSGWASIILGIPIINLSLWFIPGTPTENKYGDPAPSNKRITIVAAILFPAIVIASYTGGPFISRSIYHHLETHSQVWGVLDETKKIVTSCVSNNKSPLIARSDLTFSS